MMQQLSENLYRFEDTCNVYIVKSGPDAVLIDFGDGAVLGQLGSIGVRRVTDILMTHHHRDQGQGLARAAAAGACIRVPEVEQDLFQRVGRHWQARDTRSNYNVRDDRFSLLDPVPIAGALRDYASLRLGAHAFQVVPTPGHTTGSITLLADVDGARIAFTGDLIAAPGKLWSLASTQWAYSGAVNGAEGVAASIPSLLDLLARRPDWLLPSHGEPMSDAAAAIPPLVERLWALLRARGHNLRLFQWLEQPYTAITPHLLHNRTSVANSYVLLSETGHALLIDFGYDMMTGFAAGSDRASRRPWLYTLPALKRDHRVTGIDAVVPTHYHDDHVAGLNLLREIEGSEVWAAANFAVILENPSRYDLPCLWFDPIPVDRVLPLGQPIRWREYELTLHPLPGHTSHAVAVAFQVDGRRVLALGDEYQGSDVAQWNYVYQNGFRADDYRRAAELIEGLAPELILPGHQQPFSVQAGYFERLREHGQLLERLHDDLLASGAPNAEGIIARIRPYEVQVHAGECVELEVEVENPFVRAEQAQVRLVTPPGWQVKENALSLALGPRAAGRAIFHLTLPTGRPRYRARVAADVTIGPRRFGQQAEALVTLCGGETEGMEQE